jgi:Mg-chelatase subunit ChlD
VKTSAARLEPDLLRLAGPFTAIARAMARQWHIEVIPHGFRCDTDGNVIHIPFTADYLPAAQRHLLHGLLDHEVCHLLEERDAKSRGEETPLEILQAEPDPVMRMLFNVFEDIRIESKWEVHYPGVAENLRALNEHGVKKLRENSTRGRSFWNRLGSVIIFQARGFETDWAADLSEYIDLIFDEIEASKKTESPGAVLELARRVHAKLKDKVPVESVPVESVPVGSESSVRFGSGGRSGSLLLEDLLDLVRDDLEKLTREDVVASERYVPDSRAQKLDRWHIASPKVTPSEALADYNAAFGDVRKQIGALRMRQIAELQTISRSRVVGGLSQGQLDGADLQSVRLGNRDVFSDVRRGRSLNTAIEVLIDFSGSMGLSTVPMHPAYYAKRTAIALAETWNPLRIPNSFVGFYNDSRIDALITPSSSVGVARAPFEFLILKDWHEPLSVCRRRFSVIRGYGDNADGEAVYAAACRLAQRKENRRILIVVSDGRPAHIGISAKVLDDHLRSVIKKITNSGIEVVGVGAGTDAANDFYNRATGATAIVVTDLDKLAVTLFSAMKQRLGAAT